MPIRGEKVLRRRCAPPALAPLPSSMSIRKLGGILARRVRKFIDHAFDRPEGPAGATDRSWPDGVALCAIS